MATFASFASAAGVCASRGGGSILANTGMGYQALNSTTSGAQNAAFGFQAMRQNTVGAQNVAIGFQALRNSDGGNNNVAVGYRALYNANAANNTAVGFRAGCAITTGASNTLVGAYAGVNITTCGANVAIGWGALAGGNSVNSVGIGRSAGTSMGTNGQGTFIGDFVGTASTGLGNTIIGACAGGSVSSATNVVIVSRGGSTGNSNGHTLWGTSGVDFNWIQCRWTNLSDCRDKTHIQDLDSKLGLSFLRKLNPVSFNWDDREHYVQKCGYEYGQKDGTLASRRKSYGFEAQQVKQVLEELNVEFEALGHDSEKDAYRITYEEMIAPLIKGVQETLTRLETLETLAA
jgi:hypothetical protein